MTIFFSENIRSLRKARGVTQESFAKYLGVSFQAVSKWERNECYPDITLLPEIAEFFGVSVDELLGIDRAKKEAALTELIYNYDNFTNDDDERHKTILDMIEKYPNDFRVQLRYLADLMFNKNGEDFSKNIGKIQSIYDNIQNNCTIDTIRICSKRYMAAYYRTLSEYDESGVTFEDAQQIIMEMPYMRDGQEFLMSYLYPRDTTNKWKQYTMESVEEEISLLCHGISHLEGGFIDESIDIAERINALELEIKMLNGFYDDGNYGRAWGNITYAYGHLGHLYFESGNKEKALENLKMSAILAKQFDEMDRITIMHSKFFNGREFDKHTLGSTYVASMRMYELMTERYPLTDEFKGTKEFQEILKILDC